MTFLSHNNFTLSKCRLVIEDIIDRDILYMLPGNAKHDLMKTNLSPCHTFKGILMRCLWELILVSTIQKFDHWLIFSLVQKRETATLQKVVSQPFCAMKSYRDLIALLWKNIAGIWEYLAWVSRRQWKADFSISKPVLSSCQENKTAMTNSWQTALPASALGG